jgi:hypothetical protein
MLRAGDSQVLLDLLKLQRRAIRTSQVAAALIVCRVAGSADGVNWLDSVEQVSVHEADASST